jgi:hypothetical protein
MLLAEDHVAVGAVEPSPLSPDRMPRGELGGLLVEDHLDQPLVPGEGGAKTEISHAYIGSKTVGCLQLVEATT